MFVLTVQKHGKNGDSVRDNVCSCQEREEILSMLRMLYNNVNSHNTFMLNQFDESMENISTEAKGEVEAFVQNKINSIALATLKEHDIFSIETENPLLLDQTKGDTNE